MTVPHFSEAHPDSSRPGAESKNLNSFGDRNSHNTIARVQGSWVFLIKKLCKCRKTIEQPCRSVFQMDIKLIIYMFRNKL